MSYNIYLRLFGGEEKTILISENQGKQVRKALMDGAKMIEVGEDVINTANILHLEHVGEPIRIEQAYQLNVGEIKKPRQEFVKQWAKETREKFGWSKVGEALKAKR